MHVPVGRHGWPQGNAFESAELRRGGRGYRGPLLDRSEFAGSADRPRQRREARKAGFVGPLSLGETSQVTARAAESENGLR